MQFRGLTKWGSLPVRSTSSQPLVNNSHRQSVRRLYLEIRAEKFAEGIQGAGTGSRTEDRRVDISSTLPPEGGIGSKKTTRDSRRADRAGPIPLTSCKSATDWKTTPRRRISSMRPAKTGPTPGRRVRLSVLQKFMGKGVVRTGRASFEAVSCFSGARTQSSSQSESRHRSSGPMSNIWRIPRPVIRTRQAKTMPRAWRRESNARGLPTDEKPNTGACPSPSRG